MKKWGKKKENTTIGEERKKSLKEKIKASQEERKHKKRLKPKLVEKDRKDKANMVKKQKRVAVRTPTVTKVITGIAAILFLFVAIGAALSYSNSGNISSVASAVVQLAEREEEQVDISNLDSTRDFVERFMREYLKVPTGEEAIEQREEQLARYMARGLDESAGINAAEFDGEQVVTGARVIGAESTGDYHADIQIRMQTTTTIRTEREEEYEVEVEVESDDEDDDEPQTETQIETRIVEDEEEKNSTLYFVVGVYGQDDAFSITSLPQPYQPVDPEQGAIANPYSQLSEDRNERQPVQAFLETFFQRYVSEESAGEMGIYYENASDAESLNSVYEFGAIEEVSVYESDEEGIYIVRADVSLIQANNGLKSTYGYDITLIKDSGGNYSIREIQTAKNEIAE